MRTLSAPLIASCLAVGILASSGPALARPDERIGASAEPARTEPPSIVERYCTNIRDAASDARLAWQMEALRDLEAEVEQRVEELEAKQAEFEDWLRRREEFAERARETLVALYANMRPDAAAQQLAILDDEEAAAVLANLVPRSASAILNEMEPERAAELALAIAGPPRGSEEEAPR